MNKEYSFSKIKLWPAEDRPREKLFRKGEHSLTDTELIAILLGSGTRGQNAVDLARRMLFRLRSFGYMSHTDTRTWRKFKGLGMAKIARIRAAFEIGRRFREEKIKDNRFKIRSSKDIVNIFAPRMCDLKREIFKVLLLDSQNRVIEVIEAEEGTVNQAYPIIREIFHSALQYFAVAIICLHNHPSGQPRPSREDREFTRSLIAAGRILNVIALDHIIIGREKYFSFADRNLM